jgi:xylan 1,4-beta-xylosidase
LRVGGPATAQAAWVDRFIQYCAENKVPVDFVSTHIYPNDPAVNVFGKEEKIPQSEEVALAVRKVYAQVKASANPELPIIFSEYNAGLGLDLLDTPYVGAWLANNIRQCSGGLVTEMSYWTFTDAFFEEGGVFKSPFQDGFGLIATGSIPKAAYYAFKALSHLGDQQLSLNNSSALATRNSVENSVVAAVWNYVAPAETGSDRTFQIQLKGAPHTKYARVFLVDDDHGSPLKEWEAMGSPASPTADQQAKLRRHAAETFAAGVHVIGKDPTNFTLTLKPSALAVIEFCQ